MANVALIFLAVGVFMIIVALPLIGGRVAPNRWYGMRIRLTMADERIWYPVNKLAGKWMAMTGAVTVAAALGGTFFFNDPISYAVMVSFSMIAMLMVGMMVSWYMAYRIARGLLDAHDRSVDKRR